MKHYIKHYVPVFVCCVLFFSCKDKRNNTFIGNIEIVSIDTKNTRELIEITSLADSVRYIKLETANESIIGEIAQVIFYDGLFYIKDDDISLPFTVRTDVIEKDNFIFSQWWDQSKNYSDIVSLYLKTEKKSLVASGIIYPKDSGFLQGHRVHFNCTDQMLEVIWVNELDTFDMLIKEGYRSEKEKDMLKSLFSNPDDDNPVLEIIYLKK
jgi:hypothetical protein